MSKARDQVDEQQPDDRPNREDVDRLDQEDVDRLDHEDVDGLDQEDVDGLDQEDVDLLDDREVERQHTDFDSAIASESWLDVFTTADGRSHLLPFCLVASLFLLWGFANGLIDVMDKHFQDSLHLSKANSAWVQFAHWLGYFLVSVPAGVFASRYGYRAGILLGLSLVCLAGFWFVPASWIGQFWSFLLGVLLLAAGLTFLETVANPYTMQFGPARYAVARINIAQATNGFGLILGPLAGALFFYTGGSGTAAQPYAHWNVSTADQLAACLANYSSSLAANTTAPTDASSQLYVPYLFIAVLVLAMIVAFACVHLPEFSDDGAPSQSDRSSPDQQPPAVPLWQRGHFLAGVAAQFCYVGAQSCLFAFFINYLLSDLPPLPLSTAAHFPDSVGVVCGAVLINSRGAAALQSLAFFLFFVGRIVGSALLLRALPQLVLAVYGLVNALLMLVVVAQLAWLSVAAVFAAFFFMSVMFPTIFALAIDDLGPHKKIASAFVCMAILGGALLPKAMGALADASDMATSFWIPFTLFLPIAAYGCTWQVLRNAKTH